MYYLTFNKYKHRLIHHVLSNIQQIKHRLIQHVLSNIQQIQT